MDNGPHGEATRHVLKPAERGNKHERELVLIQSHMAKAIIALVQIQNQETVS